MLISPDGLIDDGLLRPADFAGEEFSPDSVDYEKVAPFKRRLIESAWKHFSKGARPDLRHAYGQFCENHRSWLDDYALFRARKARYNGASYREWPVDLVRRAPSLKQHAHDRGVRVIGELPFFVSPNSSDVWANPELFLLGGERQVRVVAGVPPDYFSATGQLWGNPVYDWDSMPGSDYRWCVDRVRALLVHVDAIRLDHFRAFSAVWHVLASAFTAQAGDWVPGPGVEFFTEARMNVPGRPEGNWR